MPLSVVNWGAAAGGIRGASVGGKLGCCCGWYTSVLLLVVYRGAAVGGTLGFYCR